MAKARNNRLHKHGLFSGYAEYRYGAPDRPVSLAGARPIFKADKRRDLVGRVVSIMGEWRSTPFEHEAPVRYGLRQSLCIEGHSWRRSDLEASAIVAEAIRSLGLERPSWEQGQPEWTDGPDYCSWCRGPMDEEDRTRKQRFCSVECARMAITHRDQKSDTNAGTFQRSAARLIRQSKASPKSCHHCGITFQSVNKDAVFCSQRCSNGAHMNDMRERLAGVVRQCACCGEDFTPTAEHSRYCSPRCGEKMRGRAARERKGYAEHHLVCQGCGGEFVSKMPFARYCGTACKSLAMRYEAGRVVRLTPRVTDYLFCRQGVRITDDFREAA